MSQEPRMCVGCTRSFPPGELEQQRCRACWDVWAARVCDHHERVLRHLRAEYGRKPSAETVAEGSAA